MPTFTFEGFTEGSLVTLSAAQGAQGAAGSVLEWRLSSMNAATIDIQTFEPLDMVAPAGVWFEAIGLAGFNVSEPPAGVVYDPSAHCITYIWDFDDPGQFDTNLNIPAAWNDKNIDYGKKAFHVFENPGTYSVWLRGYDSDGTIGQRMITVNVADPDVVYPGSRTICVSNQSNWSGAPAGSQQVSSIDAARTALSNLGQRGRILLKRGETYKEEFRVANPMRNVYIGAYGTGQDPIWEAPDGTPTDGGVCISAQFNHDVTNVTILGIDFRGDWDATKEVGDPRQVGVNFVGFNTVDFFHNVFYKCRFSGFTELTPHQTEPDTTAVTAFVECEITNFRDYGMFIGGDDFQPGHRFAIVGCDMSSAVDACIGGYGKIGLTQQHGPLRYGDLMNVVISASSFYSASSWVGFIQPAVRFAQKGTIIPPAGRGQYIGCNRCAFEGGDILFGIDGQNAQAEEIPGNFIFDKILAVGDYTTNRFAGFSFGGATMRNAYFVLPNLTRLPTANGFDSFVILRTDLPTVANANTPMRFYNNTFLNQFPAPFADFAHDGSFNDLVIQNNVSHQPNAGVTDDAPIDLSQTLVGFTPRNRGRRQGPEKVQTTGINVADGQSFTSAYPAGLGQSDFSSAGRHTVLVEGAYYFSDRGQCTLTFNGSNITVTNTSGEAWSGNARLGLDQDTLTTDTTYATPTTIPLAIPNGTSRALDDDGGLQARTHFDTSDRERPKGAL